MDHPFLAQLKKKVLIFDGAMGTNLQAQDLTANDFGGLEGCNEYLVITKPEAVYKVHESFLKVGCDAVETDTFGATRIVLAEYGLQDRTLEINKKAAELAREACSKFATKDHPRFVIGSIGPTTKLPTLGHISFKDMKAAFVEQITGLLKGGVDALLIETSQDILQSKIAVIAAGECFDRTGKRVPLMVQTTFEQTGQMLLGTDIAAALTTLEMLPVNVIGMNCATGPKEMSENVRYLAEHFSGFVSVLPNAGLPENVGGKAHYHLTPDELAHYHERFVNEFGVNIVGGCCGTTPEHLKKVVDRIGNRAPKVRKITHEPMCASLYSSVTYKQTPPPLLIGERTNANGSRKFKQLLERADYESMVAMGREALKEGAHIIDVCVAFVGRDEIKDMTETISRFNQQVALPIMIDSTEAPVIERALELIGGKAIINSINLEDGERRMDDVCPLAKKFGAALVALTIDERGMAKDRQTKLEIAKRIYDLATKKFGIRGEDLFFDALTFTIGSGDEEFRSAGVETLEGIRLIKKNLPDVHTLLGLSNISFGLDTGLRHVLNSVFLHYAIEAGLDAAIVHASKILPLYKIGEEERDLARRLIFNESKENKDPLQEFLAWGAPRKGKSGVKKEKKAAANVEESLKNKIIDGDRENLEAELDRALEKYKPLEIINQVLLDGMKVVGELFGAGKMQLPFVLQSAEVMKRAVAYLEPKMDKLEGIEKGRIVLATVKGDVHDIGKNLVDIILTNNGYKVFNLGIKQPIEPILKKAEDVKADAIGLSGLLVKSTLVMKENLEEMNQRGIALPVILGGAALTRKYVEEDLTGLYHGEVYYGKDAFAGLKIMDDLTNPDREKKIIQTGRTRGRKMESAGLAREEAPAGDAKSTIVLDNAVPKAPFFGYRILKNIPLRDVFPFINEITLFRGQWQFKRGELPLENYEKLITDKVRPLFEELKARAIREKILQPLAIYGYFPCYAEGDEVVVLDEKANAPRVRLRFPRQKKDKFLCIADYFRPKSSGELDVIGLQIVTVGKHASEVEQALFRENKYTDYLYLHGLSVETAEALAEYVHRLVRKDWGLAGKDSANMQQLLHQKYQGSRYSFGYPACPHLEDQAKLFELIPAEKIGVTLTEEFQLVPEQSTSALVVHHPAAHYFDVK